MKKIEIKNSGITLVALVITIIILLILAGISIATLTGSGLFENARLAEQKSKNAQELEETTLKVYENEIDKNIKNSSRETSKLTKLYGNITSTGSYTLNDSIEKFDKILFLCGNASNNYKLYQEEFYVNFLKSNYGNTISQFASYRYSTNSLTFHMTDNKTLIIDFIPADADLQIVEIYGIN